MSVVKSPQIILSYKYYISILTGVWNQLKVKYVVFVVKGKTNMPPDLKQL